MIVCACDYRAYGDRSGQDYPKAALLDTALRACAEVDETEFAADLSADGSSGRYADSACRGDRAGFPFATVVRRSDVDDMFYEIVVT